MECPSTGLFLMFFSWLYWGYEVFSEESIEVKYHFLHIKSKYMSSMYLSMDDVNLEP